MKVELDDKIMTILRARTSHFRSKIKSKIQPHVKNMYNFVATNKPEGIHDNAKLVQDLKNKFAFVYLTRSVDGNTGLYRHPLIQQAINEMWFHHKNKDAMKHTGYYKPFPKVALALVLTVIENCIDEWTTGSYIATPFTQDAYEKLYNQHLSQLNRFEAYATRKKWKVFANLQMEFYQVGRLNIPDSLPSLTRRDLSTSDYDAAMEEFQAGGYCDDYSLDIDL